MFSGGTSLKLGLIVGGLCLLFLLLAHSCPGWLIISVDLTVLGNVTNTSLVGYGQVLSYSGIWYVRVCVEGVFYVQCLSSFYHEHRTMGLRLTNVVQELRRIDWVEVEVEMTLSLALCVGAMLVAGYNLYRVTKTKMAGEKQMLLSALASGLVMLSGILIMPPVVHVGIAGERARHESQVLRQIFGLDFVRVDTPWTIALACVSVVLTFVCSALFLLAACKQNEQTLPVVVPEEYDPPPAPYHIGYYPQFSQDEDGNDLPAIGGRDIAPLRFESGRMLRETTMFMPSFTPKNNGEDIMSGDSGIPQCDSDIDGKSNEDVVEKQH